jgi:hypothetical protein
MAEYVCKAATLKTPDGVEFLAFFDLVGELKSVSDAASFLLNASSLASVPMTVSFRVGGNGEWQTWGDKPCAKFLSTLPKSEIVLKPVVIRYPDIPPKGG